MLYLVTAALSLTTGLSMPTRMPRVAMQAVAEPMSATKQMDLREPVFPEVCEYAGITLSRYVLEMAQANPDKPELVELVSVMTSVERACKTISKLVRTAPIEQASLLGLEATGNINVQGEEQKKLDVITNTVLKNALRFSGKMAVLASEEEDEPVGVEDSSKDTYGFDKVDKEVIIEEGQKYVAVFDPLDGSSNVDANIPTGTIFGIYEEPDGCDIDTDGDGVVTGQELRDCLGATLQAGNKLVVSGYCLYSAATSFVMSFGGKTCQVCAQHFILASFHHRAMLLCVLTRVCMLSLSCCSHYRASPLTSRSASSCSPSRICRSPRAARRSTRSTRRTAGSGTSRSATT